MIIPPYDVILDPLSYSLSPIFARLLKYGTPYALTTFLKFWLFLICLG